MPINNATILLPDHLLSLAIIVMFTLWGSLELLNLLRGKSRRLIGKSQDGGSFWFIMVPAFLSIAIAVWSQLSNPSTWAGSAAGLLLMTSGVCLRQWAVFALGRHYSVVVAIEPTHQLVTSGPYQRFRHPSYTGGLATLLGLQLALGSWLGFGFVILAVIPALLYRIRREEKALTGRFGTAYQAYIARTWRLLPGW